MPAKLKAGLFSRKRALALLARGLSIDATVDMLAKRSENSGLSLEQVKRKYFPSKGLFAISGVENASREQILERMLRLSRFAKAHSERSRKIMIGLYNDPDFARKARNNRKKAHEVLRALYKDPKFAAEQRERMRALQVDPEFRHKLLEGIARYWNAWRLRIAQAVEARGLKSAWDKDKRIIATTKTPLTTALLDERKKVINAALNSLTVLERTVVLHAFGFKGKEQSIQEVAEFLGIPILEAQKAMDDALTKLAKNKEMGELK